MMRENKTIAVLTGLTLGLAVGGSAVADDHKDGEFRPLLKDELSGWTTEGNWHVRDDGVLELQPREGEAGWKRFEDYLYTNQQYSDYVLRLEYRLSKEGGNSGVFVRIGDRENPVNTGMEVQILDSHGKDEDELIHHDGGGLISAIPPEVNANKPAGGWNQMKIRLEGRQIRVHLNGQELYDVNIDETSLSDRPNEGYIALQDHGLPMYFRNVEIKELE
jgi:hypothetical protein